MKIDGDCGEAERIFSFRHGKCLSGWLDNREEKVRGANGARDAGVIRKIVDRRGPV
jgi:hypothetical protein